jgi:hypothetical protein
MEAAVDRKADKESVVTCEKRNHTLDFISGGNPAESGGGHEKQPSDHYYGRRYASVAP